MNDCLYHIISFLDDDVLELSLVSKKINKTITRLLPLLCEKKGFPIVTVLKEYCLFFASNGKAFGRLFVSPENLLEECVRGVSRISSQKMQRYYISIVCLLVDYAEPELKEIISRHFTQFVVKNKIWFFCKEEIEKIEKASVETFETLFHVACRTPNISLLTFKNLLEKSCVKNIHPFSVTFLINNLRYDLLKLCLPLIDFDKVKSKGEKYVLDKINEPGIHCDRKEGTSPILSSRLL